MEKSNIPEIRFEAYCGIYCGACTIMNAYRLHKPELYENNWNAKPEDIVCHGCKTNNRQYLFKGCRDCKIKDCAKSKGIEFCSECEEYPCLALNELMQHPRLEHLHFNGNNLETITNKGVQMWLTEQEKRWQCLSCDTSFSWYSKICPNCGKEVFNSRDEKKLSISHNLK